jgi:c-di-AMP phosphodiesterase-like protein
MKKNALLLTSLLILVLFVVYDWLQYDLYNLMGQPLMGLVVTAAFGFLMIIVAAGIAIINIAIHYRQIKIMMFLPFAIIITLVVLQVTYFNTYRYAAWNHQLLKSQREYIVQHLDELKSWRNGTNSYVLPNKYRFTSKTTEITTPDEFDSSQLEFTIQLGFFFRSKIIYVQADDTSPEYYISEYDETPVPRIERLEDHWYWMLE